MRDARHCGYRLKEDGGSWTWSILDGDGGVKQQGEAPTKAIAAACVIHQLLREREMQPAA